MITNNKFPHFILNTLSFQESLSVACRVGRRRGNSARWSTTAQISCRTENQGTGIFIFIATINQNFEFPPKLFSQFLAARLVCSRLAIFQTSLPSLLAKRPREAELEEQSFGGNLKFGFTVSIFEFFVIFFRNSCITNK